MHGLLIIWSVFSFNTSSTSVVPDYRVISQPHASQLTQPRPVIHNNQGDRFFYIQQSGNQVGLQETILSQSRAQQQTSVPLHQQQTHSLLQISQQHTGPQQQPNPKQYTGLQQNINQQQVLQAGHIQTEEQVLSRKRQLIEVCKNV